MSGATTCGNARCGRRAHALADRGHSCGVHQALAALAAHHGGVFTRTDALRTGYSAKAIRHRLAAGTWQRLFRGVYADADLARTPRLMAAAALLTLPASAVISHQTAAALWALPVEVAGEVHATVPVGSGRQPVSGLVLHWATLSAADVDRPAGIQATSAVRTVLDLARTLPCLAAVVAADAAIHAGLVRLDELGAGLAALTGQHGVGTARHVVALADPGAESPMETELRLLLVAADLPRPRTQVPIRDGAGRFLARVDLAYPEHHLAIEYDGYAAHSDRRAFRDDRRRQNDLVRAGWDLLRYTAADVRRRPAQIVAEVAERLAAGGSHRQRMAG